MCVHIRRSAGPATPWDAASLTVNVPEHLDDERALRHLRLILSELGVPQPELGAVCYCGAPVYVPCAATARFLPGEVTHIGA